MEHNNLVNIENEIHLHILQLVFLPRINEHLDRFVKGWDNHPLSTERNHTPDQLWIIGKLNYAPRQLDSNVDDFYGNGVEPPNVSGVLRDFERERLLLQVNVTAPSQSYGIDLYLEAVSLAEAMIVQRI